jgi:hypothetical protein
LQDLDVHTGSLSQVTVQHEVSPRRTDPRVIHPSASKPSPPLQEFDPIHENPVRIGHCGHVFGSLCLSKWYATSTSNRCPECNQVLFPSKKIHLYLRDPTREMRLAFSNVVEQLLGDLETAQLIRQQLMSEWTKVLMRELVIEVRRAQGYEVEWEYVVAGAAVSWPPGWNEHEDEDEEGSSSDEEMDDPSSDKDEDDPFVDEGDDDDKDGEIDTDTDDDRDLENEEMDDGDKTE